MEAESEAMETESADLGKDALRGAGDPRASLQHVLAVDTETDSPAPSKTNAHTQDQEDAPHHSAMETTYRRNANGSISSVYSGNKIPFLKKDDGQPLWRRDIQFLFLRTVFEDQTKVFTKASDGTSGHTFADIYIDAMAKSNKCSQVLREKLLSDRSQAAHMAMICLLVNVGRMNTTLNFFPEMRARVRTFHSIPSLQAQQGSQAYKQLKDGPRLKSILKGATEETNQPTTIEEIILQAKPRTNPVNLIFALSQYAPKISETHFFPPRDFFELFMRQTLSSKSRATAFLWLIWWYLESDYNEEDALANPFGPGLKGEGASLSVKVPALQTLSEEEAEQENVDTVEEKAYGEAKRLEREQIIKDDPLPPLPTASRSKNLASDPHSHLRFRHSSIGSSNSDTNGSPHPSFVGQHRSNAKRILVDDEMDTYASPSESGRGPTTIGADGVRISALLNDDHQPRSSPRGGERRRANRHHEHEHDHDAVAVAAQHTPASRLRASPPGLASSEAGGSYNLYQDAQHPYVRPSSGNAGDSQLTGSAAGGLAYGKRSRPTVTLEQSRRERVNRLLYDQMQEVRIAKRAERRRRGAVINTWINCLKLPSGWNSEDDENRRWGGVDEVTARPSGEGDLEEDLFHATGDIGYQAKHLSRAFKRACRALDGIPRDERTPRRPRSDGLQSASALRGGAANMAANDEVGVSSIPRSTRPAIAIKEESTPNKRRKVYKRQLRAVKAEEDKASTPPSGNRRRGGRAGPKASTEEGMRTGEVGIPMDVFMAGADAAVESGSSSAKPKARGGRGKGGRQSGTDTPLGRGAVENEDTAAEADAEDEGRSRGENTPMVAGDDDEESGSEGDERQGDATDSMGNHTGHRSNLAESREVEMEDVL